MKDIDVNRKRLKVHNPLASLRGLCLRLWAASSPENTPFHWPANESANSPDTTHNYFDWFQMISPQTLLFLNSCDICFWTHIAARAAEFEAS